MGHGNLNGGHLNELSIGDLRRQLLLVRILRLLLRHVVHRDGLHPPLVVLEEAVLSVQVLGVLSCEGRHGGTG